MGSFKCRSERHANDWRIQTKTTKASISSKFDVLELIESELAVEEVNAVDVVQEVVENPCRFGTSRSGRPIRKKGVKRAKRDEESEVGSSTWQSDTRGRTMRDWNSFGKARSVT